jgi:hypothetical protein
MCVKYFKNKDHLVLLMMRIILMIETMIKVDFYVTNVFFIKKRNTIWSNTMLDCERSVTRTLFMDENSDRSH